MSQHSPHLQHHFETAEQQFDAGKLGIWLFLATEILLFGAELTFVYAQRFGRGIQNAPAAQPGTPRLEPAG